MSLRVCAHSSPNLQLEIQQHQCSPLQHPLLQYNEDKSDLPQSHHQTPNEPPSPLKLILLCF